MTKRSKILIVILLVFSILPSTVTTAATKQFSIKVTTTYKILKGEKLHLYVKGHKKSKNVKWKTSNKKIATVSKKGVVKGKKGGTCRITAQVGKKKYKVKIIVFTGERTVYNKDVNPAKEEDRYESSNIDIAPPDKNPITYDEYMSKTQLEKIGLSFTHISSTNVLHISGQPKKDSLSGICKSYSLYDMPQNPILNFVYGSELRYKWNGTEFLYNTNDLKKLELILD